MTGWPPGGPPQRVSPAVLAGVSGWRLLVVVSALTGFFLAVGEMGLGAALPALSQLASLLTALVYLVLLGYPLATGLRRHEPRSPWLRGAVTVLLVLVGGTFAILLDGGLDEGWSLFEHLVTPLLVFVDWVAVGGNQRRCAWWYPLTWIAFPLLYLLFYNAAGEDFYDIPLRFGDHGFAVYLVGFVAGVIVVGYVLYGIGALRRQLSGPPPPSAGRPIPGYPPMQGQPVQGQQPYPGSPGPPPWPAGQHPPPGTWQPTPPPGYRRPGPAPQQPGLQQPGPPYRYGPGQPPPGR